MRTYVVVKNSVSRGSVDAPYYVVDAGDGVKLCACSHKDSASYIAASLNYLEATHRLNIEEAGEKARAAEDCHD